MKKLFHNLELLQWTFRSSAFILTSSVREIRIVADMLLAIKLGGICMKKMLENELFVVNGGCETCATAGENVGCWARSAWNWVSSTARSAWNGVKSWFN